MNGGSRGDAERGDGPERRPDATHEDLAGLVDRFDHDEPDVRSRAVWRVADVAASSPLPASDHVDALAARLHDESVWVRRGATWALEELAAARPDAVRDATDGLVAALDDPDSLVRENATVAIEQVATEHPTAAAGALERLVAIVRDADQDRLRRYARGAIERIVDGLADGRPDGLVRVALPADYVGYFPSDDVIEVGDDLDDEVRVHAASAGDASVAAARRRARRAPIGGSSPPSEIPGPPPVTVTWDVVDREERLRTGPLLTTYWGRAEMGPPRGSVPLELRVLRDASAGDDDGLVAATAEGFERWARIDDHPTVLTTMGLGTDRPWLATEVVDGRPFAAYATRSSFEEALYYGREIVRAVAHAHGRDVVHGGLSPRSIGFVEPIEDAWHVPKVGDWGVASTILEALERPPVRPAFAAPEQVAPEALGAPDQSTDVYGLGALLYALFAGRPPLEDRARAVADRIAGVDPGDPVPSGLPDPTPPSELDDDVPPEADDLVATALTRDRMGRHDTVTDLERDLDGLLEAHATWT